MSETKPIPVTKHMVWNAYKKVRANKGSAGIDGESLKDFEERLADNLYKVWNRLSSGTYFPPPVKEVEIPKADGKTRKLGIPTVGDRVAQMVIKDYLEPRMEAIFHESSYGYRPNRSAHDALQKARRNCWLFNWVIDIDIKGFFDNIDHSKMLLAIDKHVNEKWVKMYIIRWLTAPVQKQDKELVYKNGKGTPQGGVISPLLANLFLHYAFDQWLTKFCTGLKFERYADDIVVHCKSKEQAEYVLERLKIRMQECKLELHPEKTKIVYCKDHKRTGSHEHVKFDFLGFTFKPRPSKSQKDGFMFLGFDLAISVKSGKRILETLKQTHFHRWTSNTIEGIASELNPRLRGWINYYGKFRPSAMSFIFRTFTSRLIKWVMNKYKSLRNKIRQAYEFLKDIQKSNPNLFETWRHGFLIAGSKMTKAV
jgi:RNA-directed DNA polymerase